MGPPVRLGELFGYEAFWWRLSRTRRSTPAVRLRSRETWFQDLYHPIESGRAVRHAIRAEASRFAVSKWTGLGRGIDGCGRSIALTACAEARERTSRAAGRSESSGCPFCCSPSWASWGPSRGTPLGSPWIRSAPQGPVHPQRIHWPLLGHFGARDRQGSAHPALVRAQPTAAARRALPAVPAPRRLFAQHSLVGRAQRWLDSALVAALRQPMVSNLPLVGSAWGIDPRSSLLSLSYGLLGWRLPSVDARSVRGRHPRAAHRPFLPLALRSSAGFRQHLTWSSSAKNGPRTAPRKDDPGAWGALAAHTTGLCQLSAVYSCKVR